MTSENPKLENRLAAALERVAELEQELKRSERALAALWHCERRWYGCRARIPQCTVDNGAVWGTHVMLRRRSEEAG